MKLGWWRSRDGREWRIVHYKEQNTIWGFESDGFAWRRDGKYAFDGSEHPFDLIEFIRPLDELPPALNSAVKAAEDRVRELKQMVDETQTAWATACRLYDAAQKEVERLEKQCEVKS